MFIKRHANFIHFNEVCGHILFLITLLLHFVVGSAKRLIVTHFSLWIVLSSDYCFIS